MQLWKALQQLYPQAQPLVDYTVIERDGVQSIVAWNLPNPQPDAATLQAAEAAYDAAQTTRQQQATTLRTTVLAQAQSAVGVSVAALTPVQVRALLVLLLRNAGALNTDGTVRVLDWVE